MSYVAFQSELPTKLLFLLQKQRLIKCYEVDKTKSHLLQEFQI